jgi:formamidopyrimidine-DNA glycosylase
MDQSIFSGVGNYIRAEALYLAKLAPKRLANSLSKDEINLLCQSIVEVMETSYKYQGATLLTYKDSYGNEGKYSSLFKVYGRKTDDLGNKIIKETSSEGRTIHWCPAIQI